MGNIVLEGFGTGNILLEGLGGLDEAWFNVSERQQIMNAVDARMKTILIANGYETDIGSRVYEWRSEGIPEALIPCLVYRDSPCEATTEGASIGYHNNRLEVEVTVVTLGSTAITSVRKMIRDVIKAVGVDTRWGGLATNTEPPVDEIEVTQKDRKIAGATINFVITFRTPRWDP